MDSTIIGIAMLVIAAVGLLVGFLYARRTARVVAVQARRQAARTLEDADRQAEARLREAELAAREKLLQARSEFEKVIRKRRSELDDVERAQAQRSDELDKARDELRRDRQGLESGLERCAQTEGRIKEKEEQLEQLLLEERGKLEQISGLTSTQAKEELTRILEKEARIDAAHMVKRIEDEAKEKALDEAKRIIAIAIQKNASDYISETTVSVVMLPSDDMKGRIIGREGRNIRALEMNTGVDLIVDDTPEAVILSGFDPYRREIARVALERLIADGRIHPARIEEIVEKVRAEFEEIVRKEGEKVLLELDVPDLHPDLVNFLGRLHYRTSYGQNVLRHSMEVALLAGTMAAELGTNRRVARRAGILHDIGKALDREMEGSHLEIGIELLRKYGESEEVVHAMACHHGDYDPKTVEAVLVTAADALSAARPGARREVLESYVKRLARLEEIGGSFDGVRKCYAIQAGREIRIIVDSGHIGDEEVIWLSKDIAKRIESELTYPGHIKVTVIRETRSIEYAR